MLVYQGVIAFGMWTGQFPDEAAMKSALSAALTRPRLARRRAEWTHRRILIVKRLVEKYGYCGVCAEDLLDYVTELLQHKAMFTKTKNMGVTWQWPLYPDSDDLATRSETF